MFCEVCEKTESLHTKEICGRQVTLCVICWSELARCFLDGLPYVFNHRDILDNRIHIDRRVFLKSVDRQNDPD